MYWNNFELTYRNLSAEFLNQIQINESLMQFMEEIKQFKFYEMEEDNFKNILEVGCGTGSFTKYLAENYSNVTACDISKTAIQIAQNRLRELTNIEWRRLSAVKIENEFKSNSFDLIVDGHMLHHLLRPNQRERYLSGLKNLIRKGGLIFIETPFWHKNNIYSGHCYLDRNRILWEHVGESSSSTKFFNIKIVNDLPYLPKWRLMDYLEVENEIKNCGLTIKYFMVLENNKMIPDKNRDYPLLSDPGVVRIVATKL